MNPELLAFLPTALTILGAYTVFGMTGFGSAVVAVPLLAQFQPLAQAVALVLLLDLLATGLVGGRNWRSVARAELGRLAPAMLAGIALGVAALSHLPARALLLCLGAFISAQSLWGLRAADAPARRIASGWAIPCGLVGGVFGAAFGAGGPIYTLYLVRRIADLGALRATIASVVLSSALIRIAVFGVAGLLSDRALLTSALALAPMCLAGVVAGSALRRRVPAPGMRKLVLALLLLSGVALIVRAL